MHIESKARLIACRWIFSVAMDAGHDTPAGQHALVGQSRQIQTEHAVIFPALDHIRIDDTTGKPKPQTKSDIGISEVPGGLPKKQQIAVDEIESCFLGNYISPKPVFR